MLYIYKHTNQFLPSFQSLPDWCVAYEYETRIIQENWLIPLPGHISTHATQMTQPTLP